MITKIPRIKYISLPVAAAASVPCSFTSTYALCTTLLTDKSPPSAMLEKFAALENIVGHPSYSSNKNSNKKN